jgi:hypothetical protein
MASVAQTAIASTTTDGASATFTAQAIGADGGNDIIYVLAGARSTANATTLSVTVDGVTAAQIVFRSHDDGGGIRSNCGIYAIARDSLPDPAQTDVDVVLTHNQTCIRHAAALAVSAAADDTAHATASQVGGSLDVSLNTPASGIVIGALYNGDFVTVGWTGLTETSELNVAGESSNTFGTAYASNVSAETPRTVTIAFSGADTAAKVAASFPVAAGVTIVDAAGSTAGTGAGTGDARAVASTQAAVSGDGAATAVTAAIASVAALAQGAGAATAETEGGLPEPEPEVEPVAPITANGGAGMLHADLVAPKKRRKPRIIRMGEDGNAASPGQQAEADFHTLWESVRIQNDPTRYAAVLEKRKALLRDLEQATLIRQVRY